MSLIVQVVALVVLVGVFVWGFKSLGKGRVNVLGIDFEDDNCRGRLQRCRVKKGCAIWKRPGQDPVALLLDSGFREGDAFVADVSQSGGRVVKLLSPEGDNLGMPGSRLFAFVAKLKLGDVSHGATTNWTQVLTVGAVVLGVALLAILGGLVYLIQKLQEGGAI